MSFMSVLNDSFASTFYFLKAVGWIWRQLRWLLLGAFDALSSSSLKDIK